MTTAGTDHFDATLMRFGGGGLTAAVLSSRGAKIVSLTDDGGNEWLLAPSGPLDRPPPPGTPFIDAEMCGWDECAPSIVACEAPDGRWLPDHGDLWDAAWSVDGDAMTAHGTSLPYDFTRTIVPIDRGLRFDYRVATSGDEDLPLLWATHPQFTAPAGSRVELDSPIVIDALDERDRRCELTAELSTIDSVEVGGCRKIYADPDRTLASAVLEVPGRGRLRLRWSATVAPYLGVWFDNGAFARQPVIALEPSTGFYDSLADAVRNRRVLIIEAARPVTWSLEVTVE